MYKDSKEYLQQILLKCEFIVSVIKPETTKDEFLHNAQIKKAVIRSLEIIGKATKKISADHKIKWKNIPWKNMAGIRGKLIHDYLGVNYTMLWDVVKNRIPKIKIEIQEMILKT